MISREDLPAWAQFVVPLVLGAGGARLLAVWLENRRLSRRDYRETLESRIRDLERQMRQAYERIASLRVEVAHLEDELADERKAGDRLDQDNARLRAELDELQADPEPLDPSSPD